MKERGGGGERTSRAASLEKCYNAHKPLIAWIASKYRMQMWLSHRAEQLPCPRREHRKCQAHLPHQVERLVHCHLQPSHTVFVIKFFLLSVKCADLYKGDDGIIRTEHAPPPLRCFHHFIFNVAKVPVSWSRRTPSLNCAWYLKAAIEWRKEFIECECHLTIVPDVNMICCVLLFIPMP